MHVPPQFEIAAALNSAARAAQIAAAMKLLLLPALACARTFVDDEGTVFTTDGTPTIITAASDALSLEHMGLSHAQVIGTFGERCMSGSNLNGGHYDMDSNGPVYGDHNTADHDPNLFPVDPISTEEAAMLAQSADLTPSCSSTCYWCTGEEGEIVAQLGEDWPDFIVQGTYGGSSPMTADLISEAEARGVPIIKLHQIWASGDYSQGFIEITQRFEELANFLGATPDLSSDKAALCTEVNTFKATAAAAAERGMRAMGTFTPWGDATDGVVAGWLYGPGWAQVLNMLEELGMQLLHPTEPPDSLDANNFPYPVDFWLYDVRVALDFTSEAFAAAWPHPAVVAKQYAYWPNGGHVHSYQHAIDILRIVGEALGNANRIEDATACTEVADVTSADYRVNGLKGKQYACPKPVDYDWCAVHATPSPVPAPTLKPTPAPDDDDKDDGPTENDVASAGGGAAAAGVVVGLAAGGVLGVLYAKKTNAAPMEQKAYDVSTDRV